MEVIDISCRKCGAKLAGFVNLWTKIGKSYVSPFVGLEDGLNVISSGESRPGEEQTLVADCHLQDVACSICRAVVGLKCLEAPVNHVLHEDQIMLRLTSISRATGMDFIIQRTLKLRHGAQHGPSGPQQARPEDQVEEINDVKITNDKYGFDRLKADLIAQRGDIQKLDRAGHQIVSAFDNAVLGIEGEVKRLKDGIDGLQRDLYGHQAKTSCVEDDISSLQSELRDIKRQSKETAKLTRLENELAVTKEAISSVREDVVHRLESSDETSIQEHDRTKSDLEETRRELRTLRKELEDAKQLTRENVATIKGYAKDVLSLRAELKQAREEMARDRSRRQISNGHSTFPTQELEILTSNITKIGNRASQVETMQMEFLLLKGRVQRLEAEKETDRVLRRDGNQDTPDERFRFEASRKRRSTGHRVEGILESETTFTTPPTKRPAISDWPSSSLEIHDLMSSPSSMKSLGANSKTADGPRLTKSGVPDKRYLKRS